MTATKNETPIACALDGAAYGERVAWIAQLNEDGLRAHRRHSISLELEYDPALKDRVDQMMRQEAECCAFLAFSKEESVDRLRVTITVPPSAAEMADALLAPFLSQDQALHQEKRNDSGGKAVSRVVEHEAMPPPAQRSTSARAISRVAVATAAGAVACGVCCVLPFALPAVTAASAGGLLAWLSRAHGPATIVATGVVAAAWIAVGFQARRAQARPARATLYAMSAATAALALAIVWPWIEPLLIRIFKGAP